MSEEDRGVLNAIRELLGFRPIEFPSNENMKERKLQRQRERRQAETGGRDGRREREVFHQGPWYLRQEKGRL